MLYLVDDANRLVIVYKDEDELKEAVKRGVFTTEDAARLRREGERAVRRLLAREPPFDRRWEDWRPPQDWDVPQLTGAWVKDDLWSDK